MFYTVIATSGWQGDTWTVIETFKHRAEAEAKAKAVQRSDARIRGYIVRIMAHRKELYELKTDKAEPTLEYRFSDGTIAFEYYD